MGHGVKNVEDRFANLIRHQHPGWEIHVLAKNGLFSTTEYDLLTSLPESYEFDVLVLVYFLNDISGVMPELPEFFHRIYQEIRPGPLARHSYLFNMLYYRIVALTDPGISDYYAFTRKAYYGPPWRQQSELLTRMKAVEVKSGFKALTRNHVAADPARSTSSDLRQYLNRDSTIRRAWKAPLPGGGPLTGISPPGRPSCFVL